MYCREQLDKLNLQIVRLRPIVTRAIVALSVKVVIGRLLAREGCLLWSLRGRSERVVLRVRLIQTRGRTHDGWTGRTVRLSLHGPRIVISASHIGGEQAVACK